MDAIILAGGHGTDLKPLTLRRPKHLLPIANRPAVAYAIESLARAGFKQIALTVNGEEEQYREALGDGSGYGVELHYLRETAPQGTAGSLRDALRNGPAKTLLVLNASVFHSADLREIVAFHRQKRALATVCVTGSPHGASWGRQRERARVGTQGELLEIRVDYGGADSEPAWRPAGIYVFEREALERIPADVYYDLKEQLLPDLLRSGHRVAAYPLPGYCREIRRVDDYLAVHIDLLRGRTGRIPPGEEWVESVWTQGEVEVSPEAIVIGPAVLGEGVRVGPDARLIGPLALGKGVEVGVGALVRDSVVGEGVRIGARSRIERSIVADGVQVAEDSSIEESVIAGDVLSLGELNLLEQGLHIEKATLPRGRYVGARLHRLLHGVLKRSFDLALSSTALLLLSPVMAAAAVAVRLGSRGPILFRQARCGKRGRKFQMLKFRTMQPDADDLQEALRVRNEADGPVFKIANDPRFTRVGRFLRKYSLDELPQLWNVLRGDMSIVGPRPLAEGELRLCPSWSDARLRVKPGLTGLWQVSARKNNAFHNWIRHDLGYVRNQSFLLDLRIVFRTVAALAKGL